jgi:phosphomethylpyrimidine synthase
VNAPDPNLSLDERLSLTREPFPASSKVYVTGSRPDVAVPMREIALTNGERVVVHDTSGPYTDPQAQIDVRRGLPPIRSSWVSDRADTETYTGRPRVALDDGGKEDNERITRLRAEAAALQRQPRRAQAGANVSQLHYARRGIVTPEMEFVALRENGKHEWMREYLSDAEREARLKGDAMGAAIPDVITPEFVRQEVARGRAVIPANINTPSWSRPSSAATSW